MTLRKVLFWGHLIAGVTAGIVILIMSATGVLLTYEKQIMLWADTRYYEVTPPGSEAPRLPVEALLAKLRETEPDAAPATVTVRADARMPVAMAMPQQRLLYVDPYTGAVMGEGSPAVRRFFRSVTDWHRYLAMAGENRALGRAITGAGNLIFLLIVCSGLYLWWPRTWTVRHVRSVTLFSGALRGKARDFNWHNVIGFWCAVPLFVIVLGSLVISYPWASNMAYRIAGEAPPAPARPPGTAAAPGGAGQAQAPRPESRREREAESFDIASQSGRLDALWARAEQQVPGWRSIAFRLPTSEESPAVFTIDAGTGGQPQKRATLTLNQATAEVVRWEPFESLSPGRKLRTWLRFAHTGEFYGLFGQAIAGIASLGGVVLVCTGLLLAFRRFYAWRLRSRNPRRTLVASPALNSLRESID